MELERTLRAAVERLCAAPRLPGTEPHREAAGWIASEMRAAGLAARMEPVAFEGERPVNVIADPWPAGAGGPLIVVGAHYDTAPGTPGADDNASAVAALLEIARHLPTLRAPGPCRVQLVAYDLEEYGYHGSRSHARALRERGEPLRLMISLEMLGFTAPVQSLPEFLAGRRTVGDFIGLVGNEAAREGLGVVETALASDPALPVEPLVLPGNGEVFPPSRLSDHAAFWDEGYPALMVTDTSFLRNPHYHQPSDRPETLDYAFLARVTAGLCRAVEALAR